MGAKRKSSLSQEEFIEKVKLKYGDDYIVLGNYINNREKVLIKHKCGLEFMVQPNRLLSTNVRCFCQGGKMFDKNINSISKTHPELISIFVDKSIPYNYSFGSDLRTDFICPQCGSIIRNKIVGSVIKNGLSCPICKDGFSFPEKIVFNVLKQLNCKFEYHKTFEWSLGKEYDFYLYDKFKIIIEVNGLQHYKNCGWKKSNNNLTKQQINDEIKMNLAKINNIDFYIYVDARISDIEFIKESILNSKLSLLFDLKNIDWNDCLKNSLKSKVMEVCELWNNGITEYKDLCSLTKLSLAAVQDYLKKLSHCGLCDYKNKTKKPVMCITTNEIFNSVADAMRKNKIKSKGIYNCCRGKQYSYGTNELTGEVLRWKYV